MSTAKKTLRELAPIFNDVSTYAPYLVGEVTVKVKLFINHPDASEDEEDGVTDSCIVQIEAPPPSDLPEDADPTFIGYMEKDKIRIMIDGELVEEETAPISLDEVIEAFRLDVDSPIWELGYE